MPRKRTSDGSKMMPCHKCCPAGYDGMGRYHKAYGVRHVYDIMDWGDEETGKPVVWAWRCDNCGHFKKPRNVAPRTEPTRRQIERLWYYAWSLQRDNCSIKPSLVWCERAEMIGRKLLVTVKAEAGIFKSYAVVTIGINGKIKADVTRSFY